MKEQLKRYTEMTNEQKAQAIYNYMVNEQREALENLLMDLSLDTTSPIMGIEEWVEDYQDSGDMFELLQIAQQSKELDLNDDYIRTSIYYYGYSTNDNVIDLVDEDEAVEWIASALDDQSDLIDDIDKVMQIKFN